MKKTLLIILALILVLGLAAGCGNANTNNADANVAAAGAEDESLRDSGIVIEAVNVTLDDINIFDASDSEESYRAGTAWANMDLASVTGS